MPKLIFFFAGTGDDGSQYVSLKENQSTFQKDVIRIYIKGCQEERVGNGFLFPDLEIAANNVRNAFEGNELNLDKLRENFGDGLFRIYGQSPDCNIVSVDDITLEGFSRGAVTTFATAKKLDDLNIPLHIIANQPVPGETGIAKRLYSRYCDLRGCQNIKSAHTFLASYNLEQGLIHNYFFRQMVAKFSPEVNAQQMLFPHQHHLDWFSGSPIHIYSNKLMAESGLTHPKNDEERIKAWYQNNKHTYFTPHDFLQTIYGAEGPLSKDPIYLNMIMENAKEYLANNNMGTERVIKSEQAMAIVAIAHLPDEYINSVTKIKLYELVLKNSKRAEQFAKIVNQVTEVCDYLPQVTRDIASGKDQRIKEYSNDYKKSVFLDSLEFLSKEKPNKQDKKQFADKIDEAESKFRKQALSIDRNNMRIILKLLTNFITHITGVALIVNTINKVKTGNWLLFQHNRSENAVRDVKKGLLSDLDKLDADSEEDVDNTSGHNSLDLS